MQSELVLKLGNYPPTRFLLGLFSASDLAAMGVTASLIATVTVWNSFVGLSWTIPAFVIVFPATLLFAITIAYRKLRPAEHRIARLALYSALWLAYPVFAVRLTYLGNMIGFAQSDSMFARADAALNFHWIEWAKFTMRHPSFLLMQTVAYGSLDWQPFVVVVFLAFKRSDLVNAQFLMAVIIGLAITTTIATFLPALGPGDAYHLPNKWHDTVLAIRAGHLSGLPYVGVVTFPSFHAMMAVLFMMVFAGDRILSTPSFLLNGFMLISTCFCGQHYLVDIIAGSVLAPLSYWVSGKLLDVVNRHGAPRQA